MDNYGHDCIKSASLWNTKLADFNVSVSTAAAVDDIVATMTPRHVMSMEQSSLLEDAARSAQYPRIGDDGNESNKQFMHHTRSHVPGISCMHHAYTCIDALYTRVTCLEPSDIGRLFLPKVPPLLSRCVRLAQ